MKAWFIRPLCLLLPGLLLSLNLPAVLAQETADTGGPVVSMETSEGTLVLALNPDQAPRTVENFLQYVNEGHYDGTVFHRVIDNFMIQGGGFTEDLQRKTTRAPIPNEADNGLKNVRGSISMARTADPDSATAQFFINVKDNPFLDYPNPDGHGYTVFGRVIEGMEVVDAIRQAPTGAGGPFSKDVPRTPILIRDMQVVPQPGD